MSGDDKRLLDGEIRQSIRTAPEETVPIDFSAHVMAGLQPKRPTGWLRFRLWLTGPKSLTFTPVQVLPVAACAVLLLFFSFFSLQSGSVSQESGSLTSVRFILSDKGRTAQTVSVIGSFNDWQATQSIMRYDAQTGTWILEASLPPGDHEYVFLVDGEQVVADPKAAMTRDDGFGNKNSILFVNGEHEQSL